MIKGYIRKKALISCIYIESMQIFWDSQKRNNEQLNLDRGNNNLKF